MTTPPPPTRPEPWLRGPVPGIDARLQPVAHALLQAREDVRAAIAPLDADALRGRPAGVAAVAWHVRHAGAALDRLFTYARGSGLDDAQRAELALERDPSGREGDAATLADGFDARIEAALAQLRATDPSTLEDPREVGRARLPSTVLGLLFHAAEHTQRHVGQIVTTARIAAAGIAATGSAAAERDR